MSNFKDFYIKPAITSHIKHRVDCIPYYDAYYDDEMGGWCLGGAHLPIFVAPMACIIDDKNCGKFDSEGLNVIIPRTIPFEKRIELATKSMFWIAVGLEEFKTFINSFDSFDWEVYVCLDIANGHMQQVLDLCKQAKDKFKDKIILMAGNIANSETYIKYAEIGIDYCRVSIGNGQACLTNILTGISQDIPEMLQELVELKHNISIAYSDLYKSIPKIVIDGGMSSIRDMIIALAMGADYIMAGKIFAQCEEACGEIIPKLQPKTQTAIKYVEDAGISSKYYIDIVENIITNGRMYYGMSTERAQREMGNIKIKHAEGKEYWVPVEYTLHDWVKQFDAAISSTMSYCDKTQLTDFIGKVIVKKYS